MEDERQLSEPKLSIVQKLAHELQAIAKALQPKFYRDTIQIETTSSERIDKMIMDDAIAASNRIKEENKAKLEAKRRSMNQSVKDNDSLSVHLSETELPGTTQLPYYETVDSKMPFDGSEPQSSTDGLEKFQQGESSEEKQLHVRPSRPSVKNKVIPKSVTRLSPTKGTVQRTGNLKKGVLKQTRRGTGGKFNANAVLPLGQDKKVQVSKKIADIGVQVHKPSTSKIDVKPEKSAGSESDSDFKDFRDFAHSRKTSIPFFLADRSLITRRLTMERERNFEMKFLRRCSHLTSAEAREDLQRITEKLSRTQSQSDLIDYNPYEHRNIQNEMTNFESSSNLIQVTLGLGLLRVPYAFKYVGLYQGLIGSILLTALVTLCINMLVHVKYEICKRRKLPFITFGDTVKQLFEIGPPPLPKISRWSAYAADTMVLFCQLAKLTSFVVFLNSNGKTLLTMMEKHGIDDSLASLFFITPIIAIMLVKDLKRLALFSVFANLIACCVYLVLIGDLIKNLPEFNTRTFGSSNGYPIFVGIILSNWSPFATALAVECHMKNPESFVGWLGTFNVGMAFSATFFVAIGFFGFWKYGNETAYNILDNIQLDQSGILFTRLSYFLIMNVGFAIQAFLPIEILWESYILKRVRHSQHHLAWQYLLRISFTTIPFFVASFPPLIRMILTSFRATMLPILQLFYPALLHFCLKWQPTKTTFKIRCYLLNDICIMMLAVIALAFAAFIFFLETN